jgi:hypothetical protein
LPFIENLLAPQGSGNSHTTWISFWGAGHQVRRFIFFNRVRFTFPDEPAVWIEITPRLAAKIQKAIACDWFSDAGH